MLFFCHRNFVSRIAVSEQSICLQVPEILTNALDSAVEGSANQ